MMKTVIFSNDKDEQLNNWNEQNVRKVVWQKEQRRLHFEKYWSKGQGSVHLLLDDGAGGAEGRCLQRLSYTLWTTIISF